MLKKFVTRYGTALVTAALFIGQLSANLACDGPFYQSKVPAQLLEK